MCSVYEWFPLMQPYVSSIGCDGVVCLLLWSWWRRRWWWWWWWHGARSRYTLPSHFRVDCRSLWEMCLSIVDICSLLLTIRLKFTYIKFDTNDNFVVRLRMWLRTNIYAVSCRIVCKRQWQSKMWYFNDLFANSFMTSIRNAIDDYDERAISLCAHWTFLYYASIRQHWLD